MKPFLKWAGGKARLAAKISEALPKANRLIEPFAGSGAVFLNTDYPAYLLAEKNSDLINLYEILKKEGSQFIEYVRDFVVPENNNEKIFYEYRTLFNSSDDIRLKSALFIYLNRHGFNGLCRYNASGAFNVPFGRYSKPLFPEAALLNFYEKSQQAEFVCCDFIDSMKMADVGDTVYCDPPYVPLSQTSSFSAYATGGFGEKEQLALVEQAKSLANNNITVVLSNHDCDFVREHYKEADVTSFKVSRMISRDGQGRQPVSEVLAVFR